MTKNSGSIGHENIQSFGANQYESPLEILKSVSNESEPSPIDTLGFVPLSNREKNLGLKLYGAYEERGEVGPASYMARIAKNKKGGRERATISNMRDPMISSYHEAIKDQELLEVVMLNVPELGNLIFEDEGKEDAMRDRVASYVSNRQAINGMPASERVSLKELMRVSDKNEVAELIDEVYSNAVRRENFWLRIINMVRDHSTGALRKIPEEEGVIPTSNSDAQKYRRGTTEDPYVQEARRHADNDI